MRIELPKPTAGGRLALGLVAAVFAAACGTDTSTTGATTTETFTGVVNASSSWLQTVNIVGNGEIDVQVASITPQSTITIGVGIGQMVSGQCALITYLDNMRVGSIASALVAPGSYCIDVVDLGNIQGSDTVTLTATHP
jgi:hypothetical protein